MMKVSARKKKHQTNYLYILFICIISALFLAGVLISSNSTSNTDPRSKAVEDTQAFVTKTGTNFYLNGKIFKFVGFNLFDAAGSGTSPYSCVQTNGWFPKFTNDELNTAFTAMKDQAGATVLRFWAYQKYTKNGTDFSGIDNVISLAKQHGFKVIPVLENGPGDCTEPGGGGNNKLPKWSYQNDTWYTDGYKVPNAPYTLSYRDYVKAIVTRYKDEPTIFGWMMMNEADTSRKVNGKSPLVSFAQDIGSLIKTIDHNHLVTVGTQSNGASGATGQDFLDVYGLDVVDFTEAHDWAYWGSDTQAIPGGIQDPLSPDCLKTYQAKIGCSLVQSIQILKKPYIIGEAGIAATDATSRLRRAQLIDQKMNAFFQNGTSGYLYWQWNHVVDSEHFDVLANTNDPLLPVMKKYSGFQFTPPVVSTILPSPITTIITKITTTPTYIPQPTTYRPSPTHPTSPTATPGHSNSPTPIPFNSQPTTIKHIEGESFIVITGTNSVISDPSASQQKAMEMITNGSIKGNIYGAIQKLTFRMKADICQGYPHVIAKIDGKYILDQNIYNTAYTDYSTNSLAYMSLGNTTHTIEIQYNNDNQSTTCIRNLYIDSISSQ